jgi:DNA-binding NarL/FixJ family response regulator
MATKPANSSVDRPAGGPRAPGPWRILIVDDHPLIRTAVRSLLAKTAAWQVVGEAATAREALAQVSSRQPDVVLMDLALPGMDGVIATREIGRRSPATRVLILTAYTQVRDVHDALAAGARGYALKSDIDALGAGLEAVCRGERYLSPEVVERLAAADSPAPATDVLSGLSGREREIFRLAAECLTTGEIARELCISRKTVDTHLYRIHRKLGLRNSAELVRFAVNLGLIHFGRSRDLVGFVEATTPGPALTSKG